MECKTINLHVLFLSFDCKLTKKYVISIIDTESFGLFWSDRFFGQKCVGKKNSTNLNDLRISMTKKTSNTYLPGL